MAHLQNWFGLLPPDIATSLPWSESLDKPRMVIISGFHTNCTVYHTITEFPTTFNADIQASQCKLHSMIQEQAYDQDIFVLNCPALVTRFHDSGARCK